MLIFNQKEFYSSFISCFKTLNIGFGLMHCRQFSFLLKLLKYVVKTFVQFGPIDSKI